MSDENSNSIIKTGDSKEADFYRKLRAKLHTWLSSKEGKGNEWSKYLIWAPDLFYLMWKLSLDVRVPKSEKIKLLGALAYFISPIDLLPEAIFGPAAFTDDIALAAYVLNGLMTRTDPEIIRELWPGDDDVLEVIKRILDVADRMIGKGLWNKLKGKIG